MSDSRPTYDLEHKPSNSSYYTLQKMNQMHHEIVRRIVMGQKDHEIAEALGCSKATIKYTRETPIVKQKIRMMQGQRDASAIEMRKHLQDIAPVALHEMEKILHDETETGSTRARIAMDILDRAGYGAVKKTMDMTKMTEDRIDKIKERAKAEGLEDVEEAEIIDESGDEAPDQNSSNAGEQLDTDDAGASSTH